jgi:uncharacterized membrane protein
LSNNSETFSVRMNRWLFGLSRRWLRVALLIVGIYVGLPIAAPVLMELNLRQPAYTIYTIYSPLCHQFAFRTWFLFGEQPAYPRGSAEVPGLKPFESYAADISAATKVTGDADYSKYSPFLLETARNFIGNERMGWKMALCERDIAIYGGVFIGGLIYSIPRVRRRLRPVPLWLYVFLGLLPIGIDGGSQLLSESIPAFTLFAARETTPLFRSLTGLIFGLMNAWLAFPYLEESFRMTATEIAAKFAAKGKTL